MQPKKVNLVSLLTGAIMFCLAALAAPAVRWLTASPNKGRGNSEPASPLL